MPSLALSCLRFRSPWHRYTQQTVRGLSDADPDAPLTAAFVPVADGMAAAVEGSMVPASPVAVTVGAHAGRCFLLQSGFKPLVFAMALARAQRGTRCNCS